MSSRPPPPPSMLPRTSGTLPAMSVLEGPRPLPDRHLLLPPLSQNPVKAGQKWPQISPKGISSQASPPPLQSRTRHAAPYDTILSESEVPAHPLALSERYPLAPPRHILRQPYQSDTFVPSPPSNIDFTVGGKPVHSVENTQSAARRQVKKIGQRREALEDYLHIDSSSAPSPSRSHDKDRPWQVTRYPRQSRETFIPPTTYTASSQEGGNPAVIPVERLGSDGRPLRPLPIPPQPAASTSVPPIRALGQLESSSSMQISKLISSEFKLELVYNITIRQQPIAARACGFGERDRRAIDPPPILEMTVDDPNATSEEMTAHLRYPFSVMHCTLWNADTNTDDTAMEEVGDRRQQRRLMGTLVASPFVGKDEYNVEGCFFCFPDLSCRTTGRYRLKFVLMVLNPSNMGPGGTAPFRATIMSEIFHVFAAKDFPGMRSSTELTRRLKDQGCLISVKKGIEKIGEKSTAVSARDDSEEEDDDDGDDDGDPPGQGRSKRAKK